MSRRTSSQAGVVLPTTVMVASVFLLALAGLFYLATQPKSTPDVAASTSSTSTSRTTPATPTTAMPTDVAPPVAPTRRKKPALNRSSVYVEVYNNSSIAGLAGRAATKAQGVGWNVVGSDNWYGTVEASTVYFPGRLQDAARVLARDLGVRSTKPAIAPMRMDRLTVILTGDYRG